MTEVLP